MGIYSILAIIVICIGINVIYKNFLVLRKPERPQYIRINFGNVHKSNTHFISSMLILGFIPFRFIEIFLLKMELFSIIYPLNKTPEQVISDLKSDVRTQNMINFASQFTTSNTLLTSIQKKPFVGKAIIVKDGVFRKDLMDLLPIEIVARDTSEIETIILLESKKKYLLVNDAENKVDTLFLEKVK